ncbi:MAG: cytochrome c biogenesis protein ResB, partial [Pyrinomonadaceae bacterium]
MSTIEETKSETRLQPKAKPKRESFVARIVNGVLGLLSSVRFGIVILCLLVAACMTGMLIMQQSVEGFDKYFAELTPSQKLLYGTLGFFDIYHAWYFNALLMLLSLSIVLASIDRFPGAWLYIRRKKLEAAPAYIKHQKSSTTFTIKGTDRKAVAERVREACRSVGLKPTVTEKGERTFLFAERGVWNRLGAYAVHVALLTTFFGGFMTAQFGRTGQMKLMPGISSSEMQQLSFNLDQIVPFTVPLPFTITCTDIQQKLIKKEGTIQANNTLDWLTRIRIKDETGEHEGLVHLNEPLDYRGYRFFQASFDGMGQARNITLRLTPQSGGQPFDVSIPRNGSTALADGTKIEFLSFFPDFVIGQGGKGDTASQEYNKPAALLRITTPGGEQLRAYAFAMDLPDGAPVGAPVGGYKFKMTDFEKVPLSHILSIQHDPGKSIVYLGFTLLILTLCA